MIANRKLHFYNLFESKGLDLEDMAKIIGIKRDSLYRKVIGVNGFSEKDIKKILNALEMAFSEVFI